MDPSTFNIIYVDRRARGDVSVFAGHPGLVATTSASDGSDNNEHRLTDSDEVRRNVRTLLSTFREVYLCTSGAACRAKASQLNEDIDTHLTPTIIFISMPTSPSTTSPTTRAESTTTTVTSSGFGQWTESSFPPTNHHSKSPEDEDGAFYGMQLLQYLVGEIQYQNFSRLIVPVAVMPTLPMDTPPTSTRPRESVSVSPGSALKASSAPSNIDAREMLRCLDAGAADVLASPLVPERIAGCAMHAYRAHKDASNDQHSFLAAKRQRKRSWVGVNEERPYGYLREAMVSNLLDNICKPHEHGESFTHTRLVVLSDRRDVVARAIGQWDFSAHDFSDDELLHGALLMLQHALSVDGLEQYHLPTESLTNFLIATRTAYNAFVPYHNFRHVVDVLQAVFYFLLQTQTLPTYPLTGSSTSHTPSPSPMAGLIRPFDALTLLISAVGHDVGHPGVNNAFLVTLNAPLAQLYNDQSVLESFHCAAFSQILRRYWPTVFQSTSMRKLMINLILATDMGLHFDYMKKMGHCQDRLAENPTTDGWDGRLVEEQRTLACSLLIKCADISNVGRTFDVAAKWASILTDEFARQASMEDELEIPSALFAPPIRDSIVELGKSQIGFMNLFALPLFQGVADILPGMQFSVNQMQSNKRTWELKIETETAIARSKNGGGGTGKGRHEKKHSLAAVSPRSSRPASLTQPETFAAAAIAPLNHINSDASAASAGVGGGVATQIQGQQDYQSRPESGSSFSSTYVPAPEVPADAATPGPVEPTTHTRSEPSLVAVLVSSPKPQTGAGGGNVTAATAAAATTKPGRRKSSEKSSLPSSQDRHSQTTSPTNMAYSPTTQGTSFLSVDSTDKTDTEAVGSAEVGNGGGAGVGGRGVLVSNGYGFSKSEPRIAHLGGTTGSGTPLAKVPTTSVDSSPTPPKGVRHRTSKWRLNFWRGRKRDS